MSCLSVQLFRQNFTGPHKTTSIEQKALVVPLNVRTEMSFQQVSRSTCHFSMRITVLKQRQYNDR